jgi:hypothetical protein
MIGNVAAANSTCWICGAPATTGEHGTKRSDLRDVFGPVAQGNPLFLHNSRQRNRRVGSLDAKALKLPAKLCARCNNTRTQPHDLAWEKLSAGLRTWTPALGPGTIVWPKRIFGADRAREMLNVHLYFAKLFGCHIAGNNIPLDISGFADAIKNERPLPRVYLNFGCGRLFDGKPLVGMTDMWITPPPDGGFSSFATWYYDLGFVGINVLYAEPGERRQGLIGAWHPRQGANRLTSWMPPSPSRSRPTLRMFS